MNTPRRRSGLALLIRATSSLGAAMLLALVATGCARPAHFADRDRPTPGRPPNIVLIISDDLGYAEVGCYGQKLIKTPNIDALAALGTRFTNAYSGSCVCAPSRCTLLTGLHTGHAAIRDNKELNPVGQEPLPAESITIAHLLKQRGYTTAAIGKWGLGPPGSTGDPAKQGFDSFFGYLCQRHAHNHCPPFLYRNSEVVSLPGNKERWDSGSVVVGAQYAPDLFRNEAEKFISDNRSRPFFLLFATPVPHLALQVPDDSLSEYKGLLPDTPYDGKKGYLKHDSPRAAYAAMVTRMDRDIGHLLARLRDLGLQDNTIVIFTSDNGPTFTGGTDSSFFESAAGFRGLKCQLYEGGIRVPLIISQPGTIRQNTVSHAATGNWDLLPTIAHLAGIAAPSLPSNLDGIDLSPQLLTGEPLPPREHLYWEYASGGGWQAVRLGDFKGVRRNASKAPHVPIEIYNLSTDPAEKVNIAPQHPDIARRMDQIMASRTPSPIVEWNFSP
ncbi:MAG: arylsulfatase [Planctomycetota bacterium]